MAKSVRKNYIFNLAYQLLLIAIPLVVTPYVSRVLRPEGIGQYGFSFSIITYFTLFAALGFSFYGQREVAAAKDERAQSVVFWEIIICRSVSFLLALGVNLLLGLLRVYGDYSVFLLIMSFNIIGTFFDIAFFYQGREEFGKIALSSSIVRILGVASIFVFVKGPDDVWKYTLINSLATLFGFVALWPYLIKELRKVTFKELRPFRHLKGTIILFLPTIAISIYTVLDRTLIGVLVPGTYTAIDPETGAEVIKKYSDLENGYYEQSEKVVKMVLTIITCIGSVMTPRNTREYANGNYEQVKKNIYTSSAFVWLLGIPMLLGLVVIAPTFVPLFFGEGYEKCVLLMRVFSPLVIFIGFSHIYGLQYLIPSKQDKKYNIAYFCGAGINLILNLIFIRFWWSIGAAIATIVAEGAVTLIMAFSVRKEIDWKKMVFCSWRYIVAGGIMFVPLYFLEKIFPTSWGGLLGLVGIGIVVYFVVLTLLKDPLLWQGFGLVKAKFKKAPAAETAGEMPDESSEGLAEKVGKNADQEEPRS